MTTPPSKNSRRTAIEVIVLFGLVSLFGDIVYEGARSVNGPYLKTLGANAALVGLIAGIGEFIGYAIRLIAGYFSDKARAYWLFTFIGYGMLISVPLLSLTGTWQVVALLIVMERLGKAIRSPARDTILSQTTKVVGTGFGFGLHEAMDQIGAIAGPLIFVWVLSASGKGAKTILDYRHGYSLLWLPFVLVMACVFRAYMRVPDPAALEETTTTTIQKDTLTRTFWLYTLFTFVTTAGFANFILIGYHGKASGILPDAQIPLLYAIAMALDGVIALIVGKTYDILKEKKGHQAGGLSVLVVLPVLTCVIAVCAFSSSYWLLVTGILLWGLVMGMHETVMRSAIADITPIKKRGTGYGIFNAGYGIAMFLGSALMGLLYDRSRPVLIGAVIALEAAAFVIFFMMRREISRDIL